ncbi:hypothetical protein [Flagellimonas sp. 2504JD4-2]
MRLLIRGSLVRAQEGEQNKKELHESVALFYFTLLLREVYPERSRGKPKRCTELAEVRGSSNSKALEKFIL